MGNIFCSITHDDLQTPYKFNSNDDFDTGGHYIREDKHGNPILLSTITMGTLPQHKPTISTIYLKLEG